MPDIKELYQDVILEHGQNPRSFGKMKKADFLGQAFNPLCGDRYLVYLKIDKGGSRSSASSPKANKYERSSAELSLPPKGAIKKISFEGEGCLISKASGSLMSEILEGKTIKEAQSIFTHFQKLARGESFDKKKVEKLAAFSGLYKFPLRIKCALLPWYALKSAYEKTSREN